MPLFFFDLRDEDGALEQDDVGIDLPDFETAYLEAHRTAIDLWAESCRGGCSPGHARFEVRDVLGRVVLDLPFTEALNIRPSEVKSAGVSGLINDIVRQELTEAEALLDRGDKHIFEQTARVARLERKGYDATLARSILATFIETQSMHRRHRDQLKHFFRFAIWANGGQYL
ncbi:MAG: hypothetical protein JOZ94_24135 [Xanthobacteraceae bacterium]|nr:hypothetical protein [Xanthobacteraceae bacterium]MBV9238940.1 hypothetical protein [Xanthobacteraceae bacterium]MBV9626999.1 hypothetical protein [Xanthobacteraceae bacterium]